VNNWLKFLVYIPRFQRATKNSTIVTQTKVRSIYLQLKEKKKLILQDSVYTQISKSCQELDYRHSEKGTIHISAIKRKEKTNLTRQELFTLRYHQQRHERHHCVSSDIVK
jgi:hypothetical protein